MSSAPAVFSLLDPAPPPPSSFCAADRQPSPREALLQLLDLHGDAPEGEFDDIVELAATLCGKPLGAVTILDDDSNYTRSTVGMPATRVAMHNSICRFTVLSDLVTVIEDTHADTRFDHNHAVVHCENGIRFYAGTPLTTVNGTRLGALCVMDTEPSTLTPDQARALELLGRQVSLRLQLRERVALMAKMAEERELARQMFDCILNTIPFEIHLKDSAGRIQFYNRKLQQRFNISATDWLGKTSHDLWDHDTAENIVREDVYVLSSGRSHESLAEVTESNGRVSFWRCVKVPCPIPGGQQLLASCAIDITEQMERERKLQESQDQLEEANRKLNSLALTDGLTGLWNRRAFDARLETNLIASHRSKKAVALILVDIDNFKRINDTHGHSCGDEVLQQVAGILNRYKRAEDIACRFGGEEFAILLPATDMDGAVIVANRVLAAMHAFAWRLGPVTASMGIAVSQRPSPSDELIDAADTALYKAKHTGKNRVVCFTPAQS